MRHLLKCLYGSGQRKDYTSTYQYISRNALPYLYLSILIAVHA
jgi:hypothetical protein